MRLIVLALLMGATSVAKAAELTPLQSFHRDAHTLNVHLTQHLALAELELGIDVFEFGDALMDTVAECASGDALIELRKTKDVIRYTREAGRIHIDCDNYQRVIDAGPSGYMWILHAYLVKLRREGERYHLSSHLVPLLQQVKMPTGSRAVDSLLTNKRADLPYRLPLSGCYEFFDPFTDLIHRFYFEAVISNDASEPAKFSRRPARATEPCAPKAMSQVEVVTAQELINDLHAVGMAKKCAGELVYEPKGVHWWSRFVSARQR